MVSIVIRLIEADCKYVQKVVKHICSNWFLIWPKIFIRARFQRLQHFLYRLYFGEKRVGYLHRGVDNLFGKPVHHGKAGDRRSYTIRDKIAVFRYVSLQRPRGGGSFEGKHLVCMPWFVCR